MSPLDFAFPLMSDPAQRAPWAVDPGELLSEIERELERRARTYPAMIAKGAMSAQDADGHIAVLAAIAEDRRGGGDAAADLPTWDAKIRELRREIAIRRAAYLRRVNARTMTAADARAALERLDAAHWRMWICMEGWTTPAGKAPLQGFADLRAHAFAVEAWERAARAAGDRAARPVNHFQFPPDWDQSDIAAWARGDIEEKAALAKAHGGGA